MKRNKNYGLVFSAVAILILTACGGGGSGGGVNPESSPSSRYAPNHVYDMADYLVTSRLSDEMSVYRYKKQRLFTISLSNYFTNDVEILKLDENEFMYTEDVFSEGERVGFITINKDTIKGKIGVGLIKNSSFVRQRYLKVGDKYTFFNEAEMTVTCTLENHYDLFNIKDALKGYIYSGDEKDVLKISCIYDGLEGKENLILKEDTFYAKGQGYILKKEVEIDRGFETLKIVSVPEYDIYN